MNVQKRLIKVQAWLNEPERPDGMLITAPENVYYLTGFTGSFGALVVQAKAAYFITDARYTLQAAQEVPHCERILLETTLTNAVTDVCKQAGIADLGFERERMMYHLYEALSQMLGASHLHGISGLVEGFRAVKDEEELQRIAAAQHICDEAFQEILPKIQPGRKENEIACMLEFAMREKGATDKSFETIVASGHRSAMPHGTAGEKRIEKGDLIVMDFGCKVDHYCSDITRTIALGHVSPEQRRLYEVVHEAQKAALSQIKAGVIGRDLQAFVQERFDEAGFGAYFGHGLGHSVGLEVHEEPRFSRLSRDVIPANACITVEPGLYVPGLGGVRIEDLVVVTETSIRNLTLSPKELLVL